MVYLHYSFCFLIGNLLFILACWYSFEQSISRSKFENKYVLIINSLASSIGFNCIMNDAHSESKYISEYTFRQGKNVLFKGFTLKLFSIFSNADCSLRQQQGYQLPQLLSLSLANLLQFNPAVLLCEQLSDSLFTLLENVLDTTVSFRGSPDLDCAIFVHCNFELLANILIRYADIKLN